MQTSELTADFNEGVGILQEVGASADEHVPSFGILIRDADGKDVHGNTIGDPFEDGVPRGLWKRRTRQPPGWVHGRGSFH